jgi:hypothetical protein
LEKTDVLKQRKISEMFSTKLKPIRNENEENEEAEDLFQSSQPVTDIEDQVYIYSEHPISGRPFDIRTICPDIKWSARLFYY